MRCLLSNSLEEEKCPHSVDLTIQKDCNRTNLIDEMARLSELRKIGIALDPESMVTANKFVIVLKRIGCTVSRAILYRLSGANDKFSLMARPHIDVYSIVLP